MIKGRKILDRIAPYQVSPFSRKHKIRLDFNENRLGCSPSVMKAIKNISHDDLEAYPEYEALLEKLARHLRLPSEKMILTNGGDEAIQCIMDCYVEKGEEVIIPVPNFTLFSILAQLREAKISEVLYNKDFSFPVKGLLARMTKKTKMAILSNPASPMGTSIGKEDLIKILIKARANEAIILLDETYYHFSERNYGELINEFDNLFIVRSFSKAYGLAGLRLGHILSAKKNIENLSKVILPYSVNSIAILAGCAALEDKEHFECVVQETKKEKRYLYQGLKALIKDVRMTDTNFLLANFGRHCALIHQRLMERGILVKNLDSYPLLRGFLRITIGNRRDNALFLKALGDIVPAEAILFDMDGVLVDVSSSYRLSIKKTAEHFLKRNVLFKEIEEYKAKGGYNNDWDLTEAIIVSHGMRVSKKEIIKIFQNFYKGNNFDGFVRNEKWLLRREILNHLRKDYKLGIVTGRPRDEARSALKRFKVENYFGVVISMEDVKGRDKPNPHGLHLALKALDAKRAIYLGDTIDDVKASLSAGTCPIGVMPSRLSKRKIRVESFRELGVKHILKDVNQILEVLR